MVARGLIVCVLTLPCWSVAATQSVSVIDAGGQGSSSAKYTNTASFGAIGGFSGDSASAVVLSKWADQPAQRNQRVCGGGRRTVP